MEVPKVVALGYGVPPKPDFWMTEGVPNELRLHVASVRQNGRQVDVFDEAALAVASERMVHPVCGRTTRRITTARSCWISTATTSKPSVTIRMPGAEGREHSARSARKLLFPPRLGLQLSGHAALVNAVHFRAGAHDRGSESYV